MYLENARISLRALEPEDLETLYRWENDTNLWEIGCTTEPYSRYILKEYIAYSDKTIYEKKQLRLMIMDKEQSVAVGTIDLTDFDPYNMHAGVGLLIDSAYRGKGYAYEALELVCTYAFDFLHLEELHAHVPVEHVASTELFKKAAFTEAGVLRHWLRRADGYTDVAIWQRLKANLK